MYTQRFEKRFNLSENMFSTGILTFSESGIRVPETLRFPMKINLFALITKNIDLTLGNTTFLERVSAITES